MQLNNQETAATEEEFVITICSLLQQVLDKNISKRDFNRLKAFFLSALTSSLL